MPTYEYRCKSCGHEFEEFQSMSSDPLIICPVCAEPSLKRLISSGGGLMFKGSGFYLTDYKKTSSSNSNGSSTTERKPKSEKKTEDKPDSKNEPKPQADKTSGSDKK
jgi:putative FmdB family regulatory protein